MWVWDGIANALRMAWEVWWALVLGFALSGIVQAWVPRERLRSALGGRGVREAALATGLGAASSSCSYAAIAIAKTLFEKGASLGSAMAFQFASTNLVVELGIVLWLFVGWRFTLAEFVGGLLLIAVMWSALRLLVPSEREEETRAFTRAADAGHVHPTAASDLPLRRKVVSLQAWSDVAHNFRGDWQMLWKEIGIGFLIAGYVSLLPRSVFDAVFVPHLDVVVGPVVAVLAFVCSIGNVPLAAVLWASGVSFSGVVAFLFADLLIPPIVAYYRKVYGRRLAGLLVAVMFGSIVVAALAVEGIFSLAGLVPSHRPSVGSIAERPVSWNYTTFLDIVLTLVFFALLALTARRGAKDPVCGMTVDRHGGNPTSLYGGRTWFFCGDHCKHRFDADPETFSSRSRGAASAHPTSHG
ncbi:MAG TPA: permease [Gaiellaceae bacterium]